MSKPKSLYTKLNAWFVRGGQMAARCTPGWRAGLALQISLVVALGLSALSFAAPTPAYAQANCTDRHNDFGTIVETDNNATSDHNEAINTAGSTGTGPSGEFELSFDMRWSNAGPDQSVSQPARLAILVNGTMYGHLDTTNGAGTSASFVGDNGGTILAGNSVPGDTVSTSVQIRLPGSVTNVTQVTYRFIPSGSNPYSDDIIYSGGTLVACQSATITIVKDAQPNDVQDFAFTGDLGNFTLDDDGAGGLPNSSTFTIAPGTYNVVEGAIAGWNLTGLSCSDGSGTNIATRTATINAAGGENITCTFTNVKNATVNITKDVIPDSAQDFAFAGSGAIGGFSLDDDPGNGAVPNTLSFSVAPATYTVVETAVAGWSLTGLTCIDPTNNSTGNTGTRTATINAAAGETISCTFTNTQNAVVTIIKDALPDHAQDFAFTGSAGIGAFSLDDDPADATLPVSCTFSIVPGAYTVVETALAGWNLTGLTCTDPTSNSTGNLATRTVTINAAAAETITCTFTNQLADHGDVPASYGDASHLPAALFLGATAPDVEVAAQSNATADGDDTTDSDDEDGVTLPTQIVPGTTIPVPVVASANSLLDAWFDWNHDGDFLDAGEQMFTNQAVTAGVNNLSVSVPAGAATGTTYARFRLSTAGGLTPTGAAADGEVEDYRLNTIRLTKTVVSAVQADVDTLAVVYRLALDPGDDNLSSVVITDVVEDAATPAWLTLAQPVGVSAAGGGVVNPVYDGTLGGDPVVSGPVAVLNTDSPTFDITARFDIDLNTINPADLCSAGNDVAGLRNQASFLAAGMAAVSTSTPVPSTVGVTTPSGGICALTPLLTRSKTARWDDVDGDGQLAPGDRITYTITISNLGTTASGSVPVLDTLDVNTALVSAVTLSGGTGTVTTQTTTRPHSVTATLNPIPAGGVVSLAYLVAVDNPLPPGVTNVINTVVVSATPPITTVLPPVNLQFLKLSSAVADHGDGTFTVRYQLTVRNDNGPTNYDLADAPDLDNNLTIINPATLTDRNGVVRPVSLINGTATLLEAGVPIALGEVHTYTLDVRVDGSGLANPGDVVGACDPNNPTPGSGLYNLATVTVGGRPITTDTCPPGPVVFQKEASAVADNNNGTFSVVYRVTVTNTGSVSTTYDLSDTPDFDNQLVIVNPVVVTYPDGSVQSLAFTDGTPTVLADDAPIAANQTLVYLLRYTVDGSGLADPIGVVTACNPTNPQAGSGLFNKATLSVDNGVPQEEDACPPDGNGQGQLTINKSSTAVIDLGGNLHEVRYRITVQNVGNASESYDLSDTPDFSANLSIVTATLSVNGGAAVPVTLVGGSAFNLASGVVLPPGASDTYDIVVIVDATNAAPGDLAACDPNNPTPGSGLFNRATLTVDGIPSDDNDCPPQGDSQILINKNAATAIANADGSFTVDYIITVDNTGALAESYTLSDTFQFSGDFALVGAPIVSGPAGVTLNPAFDGAANPLIASNISLAAGQAHVYGIRVTVAYTGAGDPLAAIAACDPANPTPETGLFNQATFTATGTTQADDACPVPPTPGAVVFSKRSSAIADNNAPGGHPTFSVVYEITVQNTGSTASTYDLDDTPDFDNGLTIVNPVLVTYPDGSVQNLAFTDGVATVLADDAPIAANQTLVYRLRYTVDATGLADPVAAISGCDPANPTAGSGLFNETELSVKNGVPNTADTCPPGPVIFQKQASAVADLGNGLFGVAYEITVQNTGTTTTTYDLSDAPDFDDGLTIVNPVAVTYPDGTLRAVSFSPATSTMLADDAPIAANATLVYRLVMTVDGSGLADPAAAIASCDPGNPTAGSGLFNQAELSVKNGVPNTVEVCPPGGEDGPILFQKQASAVADHGNGTFSVVYRITVTNTGTTATTYDLSDAPDFDNGLTIVNPVVVTYPDGSAQNLAFTDGVATVLADDAPIAANATLVYLLRYTVDGSGLADPIKVVSECDPNNPTPGSGLFNQAELSVKNGVPIEEEACPPDGNGLAQLTMEKSSTAVIDLGGNLHQVRYRITAQNVGTASESYDLSDTPDFSANLSIIAATLSINGATAVPVTLVDGSALSLATGAVLPPGASDTYDIVVIVDATNAAPGDLSACDPNNPTPGSGLFNRATLTVDGTPSDDNTCPPTGSSQILINKDAATAIANADGTYTVDYVITVDNIGALAESYTLSDTFQFSGDFALVGAPVISGPASVTVNPAFNGAANPNLASSNLAGGQAHVYTIRVIVDYTGASDPLEAIATCDPTNPTPGNGLFNRATFTATGTTQADDACPVPPAPGALVFNKEATTAIDNGDGTFTVDYLFTVRNTGSTQATYDLSDTPSFAGGVTIVNPATLTRPDGTQTTLTLTNNAAVVFVTGQTLAALASDHYTLTVTVNVSGQPDPQGLINGCDVLNPQPGSGLYNAMQVTTHGVPNSEPACPAAPKLDATKRDSLVVDANGNGLVNEGDTLLYTITLHNTGNAVATNVVFRDTLDPNTRLVVGTVQSSVGVISTGNNSGDVSVLITIGNLPPGSTVDITYRAVVKDPLPVGVSQLSNQGIVNSREVPPTLTDDPDTPELVDPTDTLVVFDENPNPVTLVHFTARWQGEGVLVEWETSLELDTLGFRLYRSSTSDRADALLITPQMITGQGTAGGLYQFVDEAVTPGVVYTYWLEEIELDGKATDVESAIAATLNQRLFLPVVTR